MNPVSEKNSISASADENWSAIKKSDSRRLAEERAERNRYAEEYRKRLESEMRAREGAQDAPSVSYANEEKIRRAEQRRALINEEIEADKRETDERFSAASEMLKRLEEKQAKRNEFTTIKRNSQNNIEDNDTFKDKIVEKELKIPTEEKISETRKEDEEVKGSADDGIIRTEERSYTLTRSAGAYAVPLVNMSALYAEYNRLAQILNSNEEYYKARIKALEEEHAESLARLSGENERSAEDKRYNGALEDLTVAYGAAVGGYITRQRELGAQIEGEAAAENAAAFDSYTSLKAEGYAEPIDWQPQVRREITHDYAQDYSQRQAQVRDAEYSLDISGEKPYDAAAYDNVSENTYFAPSGVNQPIYDGENEIYTDTDVTDAGVGYNAERQQHSSSYAYTHDGLVDTHRYDEENMKSDYSSDEGSHLTYSDEIGKDYSSSRRLDKRAEEEEHIRFLRESKKLDAENRLKKGSIFDTGESEPLKKSDIRALADKSARLVSLRIEYELMRGEAGVDFELLSFTENGAEKNKKRLAKMRKHKKRAVKQEKKASSRYYTALSSMRSASVSASGREKLSDIENKLKKALFERERIEEELIALYGGNGKAANKVIRRAEKRKYEEAKAARKSLKKQNKRLERLHAPEALKAKARELFDSKIEAAGNLAYSKYLLKKQKNTKEDRKKLTREKTLARETLSNVDDDIKRLMKKVEKNDEKHKSNIVWAMWLIGFLIVAAGAAVCWYFFGDAIKTFFGV